MNDATSSHKTNYLRTRHYYVNVMVPIIFLLVILFFGAWVRFYGITGQGISRGDSVRYMREAKLWADGQPPKFGRGYRPATYFLQGMAIKIFGYTDYSVKILHGLMDMINILLIFLIASQLSKEPWVGVISSLLYALLPGVIYFTRTELGQVESTTFVLLALYFFVLFDTRKKKGFNVYLLLFLSGLNLGLAANTHGELAFLAPGYVLYLFIKLFDWKSKKEFLRKFLIHASIFSFSFFTPYFLGFIIFGVNKVSQVMQREASGVKWYVDSFFGSEPKFQLFFDFLKTSLKYYFTNHFLFVSMLLIGTFFIMIYRKFKKENDPLLAYFPLIPIFFYVVSYICLFSTSVTSGRHFMPLLPLVICTVTLWYYKITKQFFGKYSLAVFIGLFSILFLLNPKEIPGKRKYISPYRDLFDILGHDVNTKNKLLIAPLPIYSMDRGYNFDLYFGGNALYISRLPFQGEYNLESLTKLLEQKNIRYVFVGMGRIIDRRLLNPDSPIWRSYKFKPGNAYSPAKELKIIKAYIQSRGGGLIKKNKFGKTYYLTGKKTMQKKHGLIPNGSFEHWWKGFPMGGWRLLNGRVSRSDNATDGVSSICFEPNRADDKKGTRIVLIFNESLHKKGSTLKVSVDVKAGKSDLFMFHFTAGINGKRQAIKPRTAGYTGKGDWQTLSQDYLITPDMSKLIFHLWLRSGAREPAFADNLVIELLE